MASDTSEDDRVQKALKNYDMARKAYNPVRGGYSILAPEPSQRSRSYRDVILQEMNWMAVDYYYERRWKLHVANHLAQTIKDSHKVDVRDWPCRLLAKTISNFWKKVGNGNTDELSISDDLVTYCNKNFPLAQNCSQTEFNKFDNEISSSQEVSNRTQNSDPLAVTVPVYKNYATGQLVVARDEVISATIAHMESLGADIYQHTFRPPDDEIDVFTLPSLNPKRSFDFNTLQLLSYSIKYNGMMIRNLNQSLSQPFTKPPFGLVAQAQQAGTKPEFCPQASDIDYELLEDWMIDEKCWPLVAITLGLRANSGGLYRREFSSEHCKEKFGKFKRPPRGLVNSGRRFLGPKQQKSIASFVEAGNWGRGRYRPVLPSQGHQQSGDENGANGYGVNASTANGPDGSGISTPPGLAGGDPNGVISGEDDPGEIGGSRKRGHPDDPGDPDAGMLQTSESGSLSYSSVSEELSEGAASKLSECDRMNALSESAANKPTDLLESATNGDEPNFVADDSLIDQPSDLEASRGDKYKLDAAAEGSPPTKRQKTLEPSSITEVKTIFGPEPDSLDIANLAGHGSIVYCHQTREHAEIAGAGQLSAEQAADRAKDGIGHEGAGQESEPVQALLIPDSLRAELATHLTASQQDACPFTSLAHPGGQDNLTSLTPLAFQGDYMERSNRMQKQLRVGFLGIPAKMFVHSLFYSGRVRGNARVKQVANAMKQTSKITIQPSVLLAKMFDFDFNSLLGARLGERVGLSGCGGEEGEGRVGLEGLIGHWAATYQQRQVRQRAGVADEQAN